jgi:hypothetical protein
MCLWTVLDVSVVPVMFGMSARQAHRRPAVWPYSCQTQSRGATTSCCHLECTVFPVRRSDFSCCTEQHYGGYDSHGSGHSGLRNSQLWAGSTSIGTCDWTILYVDADSTPNFQITQNIDKLGTAWAT